MSRIMTGLLVAVLLFAGWLLTGGLFAGTAGAQSPSPAPPVPRPVVAVTSGGAYGETGTVGLTYPGASLSYVLAASTTFAPRTSPPILPPFAVLSTGALRLDGSASAAVVVPRAPQLAGVAFHMMAWVFDPGWKMWMPSDVCTWVIAHQSVRRMVPAMSTLPYTASDGHARALLPGGNVLLCGGSPGGCVPTFRNDAYVYDPVRKTATQVGKMTVARLNHAAATLPDGTVFIAGGDATMAATAELFDPKTSSFRSLGAVPIYLGGPFAVPIRDPGTGRPYVLLGGGWVSGGASDAAMLFDVTAGKVVTIARMGRKRMDAAVLAFPEFGAVLVTGGHDGAGHTWRDADLFHLPSRRFFSWGGLTAPRAGHVMVRLGVSHALVLGGGATQQGSRDLELFDVFNGQAALLPLKLAVARYRFGVAPLADGSLLIGGGNTYDAAYPGRTMEILTPQGPTVLRPIPAYSPRIDLQPLAGGAALAIGAGATYDFK